MEKQKRWQFNIILAVIVLTLINILPTVFYYTKPLKEPVDKERAETVGLDIIERVNSLEDDSKAWVLSYSKLLGIHPTNIQLKEGDPGIIEVTFSNPHDANLLKRFLPRAGSLIPFVPAQLEIYPESNEQQKTVLVQRQINIHLDPSEVNNYFDYYRKKTDGTITPDFRQSIYNRVTEIALGFAGTSKTGQQMEAVVENAKDERYNDLAIALSKEIVDVDNTFGSDSDITKRYLSSLAQTEEGNQKELVNQYVAKIDTLKQTLDKERNPLLEEQAKLQKEKKTLDSSQEQRLGYLNNQYQALEKAKKIIESNKQLIESGNRALTQQEAMTKLKASEQGVDPKDPVQTLNLSGYHPFIEGLIIDWENDTIQIAFYPDIQELRLSKGTSEEEAYPREKLNQYIINELARISRLSDETIAPYGPEFAIGMTDLTNAQSFLAFDLGFLAEKQSQNILMDLITSWQPEHADLNREVFPIIGYETYQTLPTQEQRLGLVIYAPSMFESEPPEGFKRTSIYVIAKGLDAVIQKYRENPNSPGVETLSEDIQRLNTLLKERGFIAYSGSSYGIDKAFSQDTIFELRDYYTTLLNATRENFYVKGDKQKAILDFTDVEQRIITTNQIEDRMQEDLIKWKDEYSAAQVDLDVTRRYDVPPPTKNVYWENFKLSLDKYFRGDDRKILKWGLDLSGGKTVRIGLRDQNNAVVTNPDDLNTAVNELYTRINKMGVAERTIRIENNNIILDFPGSQAFSASELVKASAMYFHIVNEKFSPFNENLREYINEFLQNVWNEAVVTNRQDVQSINEIAWEHMGGDQANQPRSEAAKILYENGLRLANPRDKAKSPAFDETYSFIGVMRGEDFSEWDGQSHPLMVLFHNYALEGASLTDIQVAYSPSEGNILNFSVKNSYEGSQRGTGSPRDDFYAWTSQFAEDRIAGTPKEAYSQGRGWRMAVVLNNQIITKPNLRAALRDAATISGRFSQREISQLAADLKAGSLSFTPKILSEQNVSAELGKEERFKGIMASIIGLALVAVAMIGYYRFAGLIATCAVLFNLLIMWGVLQNLGAALTLPGIAGIVLTIGMAVDANVLVFERIREEFKISGRIASAIQAGYRKAFSAIIDSNITTIIAALILIQFDSGPIKGFAVTLIIGLVSSMFTSLFMTRYFFAGWVQNPKHKSLNMSEWIKDTKIDFLSYTKPAVIISLVLILGGGALFYSQRNTLFGMDFTGGYSLNVELEETPIEEGTSYRNQAIEALLASGAGSNDFEIRALSKPNHLRIQLSLSMEEEGHPFYNLPEVVKGDDEFEYDYQSDPRIVWVVSALNEAGLQIQESDLVNLDQHWSMMSGQFSDKMRNNAVIALGFALLSILVYITFRFEFKFAISAVIALAHDVLITLGIMAMFNKMGLPVQIDLEVVGAIMTIIGYSLNDTIIVFDRIREDTKLLRKLKYSEVINHALNVTLSRTLMTSGTTLLVLLSLVFLGGRSIFDFSLVMTTGVVVGTFSSLFIASPVMLFFHNKEERHHEVALKRV